MTSLEYKLEQERFAFETYFIAAVVIGVASALSAYGLNLRPIIVGFFMSLIVFMVTRAIKNRRNDNFSATFRMCLFSAIPFFCGLGITHGFVTFHPGNVAELNLSFHFQQSCQYVYGIGLWAAIMWVLLNAPQTARFRKWYTRKTANNELAA